MSVDDPAGGRDLSFAADAGSSTVEDVRSASAAWDQAHRDADVAAVERLLGDGFLSLSDTVLDASSYLRVHFAGSLRIADYRTEIETLSRHGDSVVLTGRLHLAGRRSGERVGGTRLVSQLWSRSRDGWVVGLVHSSFDAATTGPQADEAPGSGSALPPPEVFRAILAGMTGPQEYDLTPLYSPEVVLHHPMAAPRPAVVHGRDRVQRLADGLRERFEMTASNVVVHQTVDPEVVVATWDYRTRARDGDRTIDTSNVSVLRVRDGQVVTAHDYHDHAALAALLRE